MLSSEKLNKKIKDKSINSDALADGLVRSGFDKKQALSAVKNWQKGLMKPIPKAEDMKRLAMTLGVEATDISQWKATVKYAPSSPNKARLVTGLISGLGAQDALDTLKFTNKRSASMIEKALKSAIANADEDSADVENLYVSEARVDGAGVRLGTKRWIPKDRGRANPIRKMASHIHITVAEVS